MLLRGDTIPGLLTMALGFGTVAYTFAAPTLTFGAKTSDGVPGAGFFPIILGFVVGALGIVLFVRGLRQRGAVRYIQIDAEIKRNLVSVALTVAGIAVFLVLWQLTHKFVPCLAVLSLYLNVVFRRSWRFNVIFTVVLTAFIYFAFAKGFHVQFDL